MLSRFAYSCVSKTELQAHPGDISYPLQDDGIDGHGIGEGVGPEKYPGKARQGKGGKHPQERQPPGIVRDMKELIKPVPQGPQQDGRRLLKAD